MNRATNGRLSQAKQRLTTPPDHAYPWYVRLILALRVDDACFARLRAHFGERAIRELSALAAFQNLSRKFNAALGVPAQGFCARIG